MGVLGARVLDPLTRTPPSCDIAICDIPGSNMHAYGDQFRRLISLVLTWACTIATLLCNFPIASIYPS